MQAVLPMLKPSRPHLLCALLFCLAASGAGAGDAPLSSTDVRTLMERGEYEGAIVELRRGHELFPLDRSISRTLAEAYLAHGSRLLKDKRYEQAAEIFAAGRELSPDDPRFMFLRGLCAYRLKEYDQARSELEEAHRLLPDDVELLALLGRVLYDSGERGRGVELWQRALTLAPQNREVAAMLERARREMAVEELMARGHSSRFDLTYDNGVDTGFALAVLEELEDAANRVGSELGYFPTARVPVSIYTRADYGTVTAAPEWSAGAYDGTIRLPFGALRELNPPLRAVLHHEYAHVVVREMTRGSCPLWLNEGVAEMFGRRQYAPPAAELGRAAAGGELLDFARLERGLEGLEVKAVGLAYQQSWSLVNHLVTSYGWHRLAAILNALGEGLSPERAIARALEDYGLTFEGLLGEWRETLARGGGGK